jgi:hypothetical protein
MANQAKIEKSQTGQIHITIGNAKLTHSIVCGITFNDVATFDPSENVWTIQDPN